MYRPEDIGDSSKVRCGFRDCHQCCMGTEMILTEEEAIRISEYTGKEQSEFLLPLDEVDGFLQLQNIDTELGNHCIFLEGRGKCSIYEAAPEGCKMYPLILNLESDETMIDVDCRERDWFRQQSYLKSQIITIRQLVSTLLFENEQRVEELQLFPDRKQDVESLYFETAEEAEEIREFIKKMEEGRESQESAH